MMRALSALEMLGVWERGLQQSLPQRLLTLLTAAAAEPPEAVAKLSIGQRDARLLTLREWAFGPQLQAMLDCGSCGERLELNFRISDVRVEAEPDGVEMWALRAAGYELRCRSPNSLDLIAIADDRDPSAARRVLLERCLSDVEREGVPVAVGELPAEVVNAAVERMRQADEQADLRLALACPQCRRQLRAGFDIGSFFWSEIDAWARRTLREVHTLASAYGWRESDILTMSPWRRQFYLDCVGR
jgi:hypothetical protein